MTLALYGKSRKRRGGLLLAALLAVIAATIGGLAVVGVAFAHTAATQLTCTAAQVNFTQFAISGNHNGGHNTPHVDLTVDGVTTHPSISFDGASYLWSQSISPSTSASVHVHWTHDDTRDNSSSASIPSDETVNCAHVTVKKVIDGGGSNSQSFTADVENTGGGTGDNSSASFSVNTPFSEVVEIAGNSDTFTANEKNLPTGYTLEGVKVVADGGNCPTAAGNWDSDGNPDITKTVNKGDNVVFCFLNKYTKKQINISDTACTVGAAPGLTFHFNEPQGTSPDGALSGTYKIDNGSTQNFGPISEDSDANGHPDWTFAITTPSGIHTITILSASSPNGLWSGNGGSTFNTENCQQVVVDPPTVTKTVDGDGVHNGRLHWAIEVDNSHTNPVTQTVVVTDSGATMDYVSPVLSDALDCGIWGDSDGTFNCTVPAGHDIVLHVSKPIPTMTATEQCTGKDFTNTASATFGPNNTVIVVDNSNTTINIPGVETTNCLSFKKENGADNQHYKVTVHNIGPVANNVHVHDAFTQGATFQTISSVSPSTGCTIAGDSLSFDCTVTVPATSDYVLTVNMTAYSNTETCPDQTVSNKASVSYDTQGAISVIQGASDTATNVFHTTRNDCDNGNIVVKKVVDPAGAAADGTTFTGQIDGSTAWGPITFGGSSATFSVSNTSHSVTEDAPSNGWTTVGFALANSDHVCSTNAADYTSNPASLSVNVTTGQTTYVCVMNTKPANGFIDVYKIVTNVNGDTTPFHFTFANPTTDVSTTDDNHTGAQNALAGAHTVTEPAVDGYTTLGWATIYGGTQCPSSMPTEAGGNVIAFGTDNTAEVTVAGNSTTVICFYNQLNLIHVHVAKVICDQESKLPDRQGVTPVTATTASAYVTAHPGCSLAPDWQFQWGYASGGSVAQLIPGNSPGVVGTSGQGWSPVFSGSVDVPATGATTTLWVREVQQSGYINFSDNNSPPNVSYSAEISCKIDGINYDNYDRIDNAAPGEDAYCVAWNVAVRNVTIKKVVTNVDGDTHVFPISMDTAGPLGDISEPNAGNATGDIIHVQVDGAAHDLTETLPSGYANDGKLQSRGQRRYLPGDARPVHPGGG